MSPTGWCASCGQRAVVALKVRELLQPAARERQRDAVIESNKIRAADPVSADLRSMDSPSDPTPAEQRKVAAQAAKAVGASPRAVEQAVFIQTEITTSTDHD
jgi:hypothetical protein